VTSPIETSTPAALRLQRPGWRDPRLWVGAAIVAVSVVAGARLMASVDDTVPVWVASSDLAAGATVGASDLERHRVRFADAGDLGDYYRASDTVPAGVLTRAVGAGELLPRAAVGPADGAGTVQVPVAVDPDQVPPAVRAGSIVDVYLLAGDATDRAGRAEPALEGASVVDASGQESGFALSGRRQLVLAVADEDARRFLGLLGAADTPTLTVVRRS
jgi:hypothetical protein